MTIKDIISLGSDGPRAYASFNPAHLKDLYEKEVEAQEPVEDPVEKPKKRFKVWKIIIDDVELDGIDTRDYPDFVDAYIVSCCINGKPATDEEIDQLNEDSSLIHELVWEHLF